MFPALTMGPLGLLADAQDQLSATLAACKAAVDPKVPVVLKKQEYYPAYWHAFKRRAAEFGPETGVAIETLQLIGLCFCISVHFRACFLVWPIAPWMARCRCVSDCQRPRVCYRLPISTCTHSCAPFSTVAWTLSRMVCCIVYLNTRPHPAGCLYSRMTLALSSDLQTTASTGPRASSWPLAVCCWSKCTCA